MSKVITIANEKGGIGKTTTAQHLSCGLARKGFKVLVIDLDSQRNLSSCFGDKGQDIKRICDVLSGTPIKQCIYSTKDENLDIIYGDDLMASAERMYTDEDMPYLLKDALDMVIDSYDYIIIDTPPKSKSVAVSNAFTTSDFVVIPLIMNTFSIEGLQKILDSFHRLKKRTNPKLEILGILSTMHENRTVFRRTITDQMKNLSERIDVPLFNTTIRKGIVVEECQSAHSNLFDYDSKSKVAQDYMDFVEEVIEKTQERK